MVQSFRINSEYSPTTHISNTNIYSYYNNTLSNNDTEKARELVVRENAYNCIYNNCPHEKEGSATIINKEGNITDNNNSKDEFYETQNFIESLRHFDTGLSKIKNIATNQNVIKALGQISKEVSIYIDAQDNNNKKIQIGKLEATINKNKEEIDKLKASINKENLDNILENINYKKKNIEFLKKKISNLEDQINHKNIQNIDLSKYSILKKIKSTLNEIIPLFKSDTDRLEYLIFKLNTILPNNSKMVIKYNEDKPYKVAIMDSKIEKLLSKSNLINLLNEKTPSQQIFTKIKKIYRHIDHLSNQSNNDISKYSDIDTKIYIKDKKLTKDHLNRLLKDITIFCKDVDIIQMQDKELFFLTKDSISCIGTNSGPLEICAALNSLKIKEKHTPKVLSFIDKRGLYVNPYIEDGFLKFKPIDEKIKVTINNLSLKYTKDYKEQIKVRQTIQNYFENVKISNPSDIKNQDHRRIRDFVDTFSKELLNLQRQGDHRIKGIYKNGEEELSVLFEKEKGEYGLFEFNSSNISEVIEIANEILPCYIKEKFASCSYEKIPLKIIQNDGINKITNIEPDHYDTFISLIDYNKGIKKLETSNTDSVSKMLSVCSELEQQNVELMMKIIGNRLSSKEIDESAFNKDKIKDSKKEKEIFNSKYPYTELPYNILVDVVNNNILTKQERDLIENANDIYNVAYHNNTVNIGKNVSLSKTAFKNLFYNNLLSALVKENPKLKKWIDNKFKANKDDDELYLQSSSVSVEELKELYHDFKGKLQNLIDIGQIDDTFYVYNFNDVELSRQQIEHVYKIVEDNKPAFHKDKNKDVLSNLNSSALIQDREICTKISAKFREKSIPIIFNSSNTVQKFEKIDDIYKDLESLMLINLCKDLGLNIHPEKNLTILKEEFDKEVKIEDEKLAAVSENTFNCFMKFVEIEPDKMDALISPHVQLLQDIRHYYIDIIKNINFQHEKLGNKDPQIRHLHKYTNDIFEKFVKKKIYSTFVQFSQNAPILNREVRFNIRNPKSINQEITLKDIALGTADSYGDRVKLDATINASKIVGATVSTTIVGGAGIGEAIIGGVGPIVAGLGMIAIGLAYGFTVEEQVVPESTNKLYKSLGWPYLNKRNRIYKRPDKFISHMSDKIQNYLSAKVEAK